MDLKQIRGIRIAILSTDESRSLILPDIKVILKLRVFNPLQTSRRWILTISIVTILALLLSWMIIKQEKQCFGRVKKRETNFELLRIICMLCLIGHHYSVHGGLLALEVDSFPQRIGMIFLPLGKIAFITFIAISMWFLCDVSYVRFSRFAKIWMETLFYSVTLTFAAYIMGAIIRPSDFVSSFFVMLGNSHGFAASYMIFLLLLPFVIRGTQNITKAQARYLLVVLLCVQVIVRILGNVFNYLQPISSEVTLFILCYVIMINIKRYPVRVKNKHLFEVLAILGTYSLCYLTYGSLVRGDNYRLLNLLFVLVQDESSLFNILAGFSLFFLMKDIQIPYCRCVNRMSKVTFGVLLLHDHNFFRNLFWHEYIRTQTTYYSRFLPFIIVFDMVLIFYSLGVVDMLRIKLIENNIVNTKLYHSVCEKVDSVLSENQISKGYVIKEKEALH